MCNYTDYDYNYNLYNTYYNYNTYIMVNDPYTMHSIIIIIISIIIILGTVIYSEVIIQNEKVNTIEEKEKLRDDKIFFRLLISLIVICIGALGISFIIDTYVTRLNFLQNPILITVIKVITTFLSLVSSIIACELFGRLGYENSKRLFMILVIISGIFTLKSIDIPTSKSIDIPTSKSIDIPTSKSIDIPTSKSIDIPTSKSIDIPN
jgi:hypothetical protein